MIGPFDNENRGARELGTVAAMKEAGVNVVQINSPQDGSWAADPNLAIPVITAALVAHPETKMLGYPGGQLLGNVPTYMQAAGKKPGEIFNFGFDTSPQIVEGFKGGWVQLTADQQPFLQGYLPILSLCQQVVYGLAPIERRYRRRLRDAATTTRSWPSSPRNSSARTTAGAGRGSPRPAHFRLGGMRVAERLIELRDIKKSYGNVYALGGVSLTVNVGEVVGLIGDNGAGKSTLIKVLAGVVTPTSGEILVRGKPVSGWNAARSREAGIETVFQDRALAVQQSIVRNIFMGRELGGRFGFLRINEEIREAGRLMREIGFTSKVFTPHSIVGQLSGGERQGVAIARAIYKEADLIVLDEPTTALSLTETAKVFHFVRQVRDSGRSILFIGHNIHHVFDIADRFVVLDRGKVALETGTEPRSNRPRS